MMSLFIAHRKSLQYRSLSSQHNSGYQIRFLLSQAARTACFLSPRDCHRHSSTSHWAIPSSPILLSQCAIVSRLCSALAALARIQHEHNPGCIGSSQLLHPSWERNSHSDWLVLEGAPPFPEDHRHLKQDSSLLAWRKTLSFVAPRWARSRMGCNSRGGKKQNACHDSTDLPRSLPFARQSKDSADCFWGRRDWRCCRICCCQLSPRIAVRSGANDTARPN